MKGRLVAVVSALAVGFTGCSGVRETLRARPGPAPTVFDAAELVDVLAPDTVPAIDRPAFEAPDEAATHLEPEVPVAVLEVAGDVRAYPLAILVWHEIVNDSVGGEPVAVTYAPLSGGVQAFRRTVAGRVLSFGASGKLYRSNLVMYDRATRSLWPQLRGEAVLGPLRGASLERAPIQISSFGDFRDSYPDGRVLTAATGAARVYGTTPYAGYDSRRTPSESFFALAPDRRLGAMERVVGVSSGAGSYAYRYATLRSAGVVYDRMGEEEVVVLWREGTRSALDTPLIADGAAVGAAGVFVPVVDGKRLDLAPDPGGFRDRQTGSTWTVLGVATGGPMAGKRLVPVEHVDAFWFAWAAFAPATGVFEAS
ncbi:MAG: DUF3179 domain-containing protein [Actinomycetota bacterium]